MGLVSSSVQVICSEHHSEDSQEHPFFGFVECHWICIQLLLSGLYHPLSGIGKVRPALVCHCLRFDYHLPGRYRDLLSDRQRCGQRQGEDGDIRWKLHINQGHFSRVHPPEHSRYRLCPGLSILHHEDRFGDPPLTHHRLLFRHNQLGRFCL